MSIHVLLVGGPRDGEALEADRFDFRKGPVEGYGPCDTYGFVDDGSWPLRQREHPELAHVCVSFANGSGCYAAMEREFRALGPETDAVIRAFDRWRGALV